MNNPNPTGSNVIETIIVLKFLQVQGSLQLARKVSLDQILYESEARGVKSLKILGFSRCNDGTIVDGAVNSPNPIGCNVIETISVLKFSQVKGSLQLASKVALDQIAYENEARSLKRLKILDFSRCKEGKIVDGAVNNPIRTGCNVIKTISALKFSQGLCSLQLARKVALDQIAYELVYHGISTSTTEIEMHERRKIVAAIDLPSMPCRSLQALFLICRHCCLHQILCQLGILEHRSFQSS